MSSSTINDGPSFGQWIFASLGLTTLLALGFAHAPAAFQRPGVIAIVLALCVGGGSGFLAHHFGVSRMRVAITVVTILCLVAIIGMTAERYRLYVKSIEALYLAPLQSNAMLREMHGDARQEKFEAESTLPFYLQYRLRGWGLAKFPAAAIFFGGEVLFGGIAGAWFCGWTIRSQSPVPDET